MTLESFLIRQPGRCKHCLHHVETQGCRCGGSEWALFVAALRQCVRADGTVSSNDVRPLIAGKVAPKRVARFYQIAQAPGPDRLLERSGNYEDSTDAHGKNKAKVIPLYVATGALGASAA